MRGLCAAQQGLSVNIGPAGWKPTAHSQRPQEPGSQILGPSHCSRMIQMLLKRNEIDFLCSTSSVRELSLSLGCQTAPPPVSQGSWPLTNSTAQNQQKPGGACSQSCDRAPVGREGESSLLPTHPSACDHSAPACSPSPVFQYPIQPSCSWSDPTSASPACSLGLVPDLEGLFPSSISVLSQF